MASDTSRLPLGQDSRNARYHRPVRMDLPPAIAGRSPAEDMETLASNLPVVSRFISLRIGDGHDAEDIVQQTFLKAAEKFTHCHGRKPQNWMIAIARNLVADYYRRNSRIKYVDIVVAEQFADLSENYKLPLQKKCELTQRLEAWLHDVQRFLEPEEQFAVIASSACRFPAKKSALALSLSLPSYKLLLHNARLYLQECRQTGSRPLQPRKVVIRCALPKSQLTLLLDIQLRELASICE